jgi:hypothetical protein
MAQIKTRRRDFVFGGPNPNAGSRLLFPRLNSRRGGTTLFEMARLKTQQAAFVCGGAV